MLSLYRQTRYTMVRYLCLEAELVQPSVQPAAATGDTWRLEGKCDSLAPKH